jgi:hypothetical protein
LNIIYFLSASCAFIVVFYFSVKYGELNTDADGKCDFRNKQQNTLVQLQELKENGNYHSTQKMNIKSVFITNTEYNSLVVFMLPENF